MTWKTGRGVVNYFRGLKKAIGAIFARQNSQNKIVQHKVKMPRSLSTSNPILDDIKKLNGDRRLNNAKYDRVRRFVDGLETKVGNRVNLDRGIKIDDFNIYQIYYRFRRL